MAVGSITTAINEYSVLGIGGVRPIVAEETVRALQQQRTSSTQVKLSSFGQIKSALSELQTAAKGLTDGNKLNTVDNAKKAVQKFVGSFNKLNDTTRLATDPGDKGRKPGALAGNDRANQVSKGLQQSVNRSNVAGTPSLASIGISQGKDGALSLDQNRFEQAFKKDQIGTTAALKQLGDRVSRTADKQLADNGEVGGSIGKLTAKEREQRQQTEKADSQSEDIKQRFGTQSSPVNSRVSQALQDYETVAAL